MQLPGPLEAALASADENYLIGLCNKGTVNRAKKDLEALTAPEIQVEGEEVTVGMGEVVCRIKAPLGESLCSCPSGGICRHRITAILWLQRQMASQADTKELPKEPDFQQLRDYPTEKLVKQLGSKGLSDLLARHWNGLGPSISQTSVITVEMPWLPATVRLLEPLEHSTCTCRSKDFCIHKAQALLYWQLVQGTANPTMLEGALPKEEMEQVQDVCQEVRRSLTAQMVTGLSRLPPSVCETVQRMAALCHTARLPELERALRALHGEYAAYFGRSASYRNAQFLLRLARAYRLAQALETADRETAGRLAGTFREDYQPVGRLELYLLGLRDFSGRSGYEGTIFYFWEERKSRFYTFSLLRPTFYEKNTWRREEAAPWGLPCTLRAAKNCSLALTGARATRFGSLSSTQECRGALLGSRDPASIVPKEALYTDFARLLEERSSPHGPEVSRLALVRPARCQTQEYDHVRQVFSLRLLDEENRDVWLEVMYRKETAKRIDLLEDLSRQLQRQPMARPVFFGVLYREDDRLKLYPIEVFTNWEDSP